MTLRTIHKDEPVVLIGIAVSAIVFAAGHFGIILDSASVQSVIEPLVVSFLARPFVSPFKKYVDDAEQVLEDNPHYK